MSTLAAPSPATPGPPAGGLRRLFGLRRVFVTLVVSAFTGMLLASASMSPMFIVVARALIVGFTALVAFGVFEQWPRTLPGTMPRWLLQLFGVVVAVPVAALAAYWITLGGPPEFAKYPPRWNGYKSLVMGGMFFGLWTTLGAMVQQREAFARQQALSFQLERSELERQALDARLRLLQAQVEPHFLFNTLANVRELVVSGSPQAPQVLDSLIAYLRAAVPRLHGTSTTLAQELQLVRSYLELMHMRMPDRLQFSVQAEPAAEALRCPPMTLLTLVENAVRHGIDPSEEGGRIDVRVAARDGRCRAEVADTGAGMSTGAGGLGTGLATLRERLAIAFGGDASLQLERLEPRGVRAVVDFPAQPA